MWWLCSPLCRGRNGSLSGSPGVPRLWRWCSQSVGCAGGVRRKDLARGSFDGTRVPGGTLVEVPRVRVMLCLRCRTRDPEGAPARRGCLLVLLSSPPVPVPGPVPVLVPVLTLLLVLSALVQLSSAPVLPSKPPVLMRVMVCLLCKARDPVRARPGRCWPLKLLVPVLLPVVLLLLVLLELVARSFAHVLPLLLVLVLVGLLGLALVLQVLLMVLQQLSLLALLLGLVLLMLEMLLVLILPLVLFPIPVLLLALA